MIWNRPERQLAEFFGIHGGTVKLNVDGTSFSMSRDEPAASESSPFVSGPAAILNGDLVGGDEIDRYRPSLGPVFD
jgi:hypothetical protein